MKARLWISALAVALSCAAPAWAGYKLMPAGKAVSVAKSPLTVVPKRDWNRVGARPGRRAESWTLDGLVLNDLTFIGGIEDGKTLFRDVDKINNPLPRFSSTMLPPDVIQLFEASYRVALGTSLMSIDSVAPARFAGSDGFRFTYSLTLSDEVRRKGIGQGAVIGGRLFLITFEAPAIHYFERDRQAFEDVAMSAMIATQPAK